MTKHLFVYEIYFIVREICVNCSVFIHEHIFKVKVLNFRNVITIFLWSHIRENQITHYNVILVHDCYIRISNHSLFATSRQQITECLLCKDVTTLNGFWYIINKPILVIYNEVIVVILCKRNELYRFQFVTKVSKLLCQKLSSIRQLQFFYGLIHITVSMSKRTVTGEWPTKFSEVLMA